MRVIPSGDYFFGFAMSAIFHPLQNGICVIERGWLNCNQIVMTSSAGNVLIDSGYGRHAEQTLAALQQVLGDAPLARLINTHCHSDHMGGNRAVRAHYRCRVTIPAGEVSHIVPWTAQSCWAAQMDQYAEEFTFDDTIAAGDRFVAADREWEAIAAPGHDMDALMFWCAEAGVLITGDALWERGMGFVYPQEPGADASGNPFIDAALRTLAVIEALKPRLVVPGHGAPFANVAAALAFSRRRLAALAADPAKNARTVIKGLFVFSLLDKGSMALAALPEYLARVPVYGELSERFLQLDSKALAESMLADLLTVGAVRVENGNVVPTMRA